MNGFGYNKDLNKTFDDVYIFHGNTVEDENPNGGLGIWEQLKPGHGTGFSSNGKENKVSNRFGIELSFIQRLKELYPNDKIALIKYAREGTSIDSLSASNFGTWEPDYNGKTGINRYNHCLKTIKKAFQVKDINSNGVEDVLVPSGILWIQGESDAAFTETVANNYFFNLIRMMDLLRASLLTDDLPVVIGKISDSWNDDKDGKVWDYGELVQYAQEKYTKTDKNATIIKTTCYYKYSDPWHYDSEGYIDFGKQFAEEVYKLIKNE